MAGLHRDGLKASEIFQIRRSVEQALQNGEEPDVAYALACREIVGVDPDAFKRWKADIFALIEGKPTPANSLLSGSVDPVKSVPAESAAIKRMEQLGGELDAIKRDHARMLEENEKLKAKLAMLEEPPKSTTPAKK
jgi:hypothetical protein